MTEINQKEYLKKYLGMGKDVSDKKKKKKKKIKVKNSGLKIIDDDLDVFETAVQEDLTGDNEDAPQIVEIIDDRPPSMQIDEKTNTHLWIPIGVKTEENDEDSNDAPGIKSSALKINLKSRKTGENPLKKKHPKRTIDSNLSNVTVKEERITPERDLTSFDNERNSDSSPVIVKREDEGSVFSPKRRRNLDKDGDISPPRKRNKDDDFSPPRKSRRDDDVSPPRRRYLDQDGDISPPRRRNRDRDNSPPRRRNKDVDISPPRRKNRGSDSSPPRRNNEDGDISPPRKRNTDHHGDNSPPRRKKSRFSDISPPRKKNKDISPARRRNRDDDSSPPRKESRKFDGKSPERRHTENRLESQKKKTLDGKTAGLQNARELVAESREIREREEAHFRNIPAEVSGANAATITRDRKTGRIRNFHEEKLENLEKQKKDEEKIAKYSRWGRGLKQVEDAASKRADEINEMNKPLARYANDEDLERHLKEQEREGDPMLAYIRKKKKKKDIDDGVPSKPIYKGEYMPNRFGIRPGHRWDGVDRSNGYEKRWFDVQNSKLAEQEESYKWSTEDM